MGETLSFALISVIVPIYKVEAYLPKCLSSILEQTYSNIEIILVDDGSPDHCPMICDEYASRDSRIKVIHKINGGLSDARNAGLEVITGDYVTFVDSDDWIEKNHLSSLAEKMLYDRPCIVVGNIQRVDDAGNKLGTIIHGENLSPSAESIFGYVWNKLYPRNLIEGIRFCSDVYIEDMLFNFEVFKKHPQYIYTNCLSYNYLFRKDSLLTQRFNEKKLSDFVNYTGILSRQLSEIYPESGYRIREYYRLIGNFTCNFLCELTLTDRYSLKQKLSYMGKLLDNFTPDKLSWEYADHRLLKLLTITKILNWPMLYLICYKVILFIKHLGD